MSQKSQEDSDSKDADSSSSTDKVHAGLLLLEVFGSVVQLVTLLASDLGSLIAFWVVHIISCSLLSCLLWIQRLKKKWKVAFLLGISQFLDVYIDVLYVLMGITMPRVNTIGLLASSFWLSFVLMASAVPLFSSIYVLRTSPFLPNVCLRCCGGCCRNRLFGAQLKDHTVNFFLVTILTMQIPVLVLTNSPGNPIWMIVTINHNSTTIAQCPGIKCDIQNYNLRQCSLDIACEHPEGRVDGAGDYIWGRERFPLYFLFDEEYHGVLPVLEKVLQGSSRVCLTWVPMGKFDRSNANVINVTKFLLIVGTTTFLVLSIFVSEAYRPKTRSVIRFGKGVMLLAVLLLESIKFYIVWEVKSSLTLKERDVELRRENHLYRGPDLQIFSVFEVVVQSSTVALVLFAVLFCDFRGPRQSPSSSKKSAVKDNSPSSTSASDHTCEDLHIERRKIDLA